MNLIGRGIIEFDTFLLLFIYKIFVNLIYVNYAKELNIKIKEERGMRQELIGAGTLVRL